MKEKMKVWKAIGILASIFAAFVIGQYTVWYYHPINQPVECNKELQSFEPEFLDKMDSYFLQKSGFVVKEKPGLNAWIRIRGLKLTNTTIADLQEIMWLIPELEEKANQYYKEMGIIDKIKTRLKERKERTK